MFFLNQRAEEDMQEMLFALPNESLFAIQQLTSDGKWTFTEHLGLLRDSAYDMASKLRARDNSILRIVRVSRFLADGNVVVHSVISTFGM